MFSQDSYNYVFEQEINYLGVDIYRQDL